MTLLDAYALIAFLVGGPASPHVRAILRDGDAAVATANLVEVLDVSQRVYGVPIGRAVEILDPLLEGPLTAVPLDYSVARRAAEIRAGHYRRSARPISLADAVLIGSAKLGRPHRDGRPRRPHRCQVENIDSVALPGPG